MLGRPDKGEAAEYYFKYIDRVTGDDVMSAMRTQRDALLASFHGVSEEASLYRYAPDE